MKTYPAQLNPPSPWPEWLKPIQLKRNKRQWRSLRAGYEHARKMFDQISKVSPVMREQETATSIMNKMLAQTEKRGLLLEPLSDEDMNRGPVFMVPDKIMERIKRAQQWAKKKKLSFPTVQSLMEAYTFSKG